jgi:2-polyprenyl-6-methoxyphenol hydroxylase-like FAD-dependent oxidoreductase
MPHMMVDAEVLVCGAGPVGLACAFLLAEAGMAVALIDAAEAVDTSPRAAFHHGPTARALEQLGLMEDLAQNAFIGGQTGHWAPEFDYLRKISFDGIMVGQDAICDVLVQRLRAMPNVSLAMATELTALRQESDRVVVQLRDAGGERSLTCRWLVGADGARSAVRRTCGIAFDGHTWPDRVYAANIACDLAGQGLADARIRAVGRWSSGSTDMATGASRLAMTAAKLWPTKLRGRPRALPNSFRAACRSICCNSAPIAPTSVPPRQCGRTGCC